MFKFLILAFLPVLVFADPLNGSLELNTSVSHAYDARSTFSNPSALGFQTELNDAALLSSFTYATNRYRKNEFSFGLSYGYVGFGLERLSPSTTTDYSRYSFALGVPVTPGLYFGSRFSTTSSDTATLSGIHSLDFGVQYRPIRFISAGLEMNHVNKPVIGGVESPIQYVAGLALAPINKLTVTADVDTLSNHFAKDFGYKAVASFEVLPGLYLDAGYHKDAKFMAGLQFNLANSKLFSFVQPSSDERRMSFGFQSGALLRRALLQPNVAYKITLDQELSEEGSSGSLLSKGRPSFLSLLESLERAKRDPHLAMVIIKLDSFPLGLSAAEDLYHALMALRERGKQIEVFLASGGPKEYLIASAATKIHMEAAGELRFLGPRSERFYAKGTLDKIGIEAELIGRGEYKSAPETFTRKDASPASKEATQQQLKAMEEGLVALLSKSRKEASDWKALTAHAIFGADEALNKRLIDQIDKAAEEIEKLSRKFVVRESTRYQNERLNLPPRVAVIVAEGDILQNRMRLLSFAGEAQVTPDRLNRKFKYALRDSLTKAIVLRISSPGGEIQAGNEIANMVSLAKTKKPVIISMGDVAASGGYMIAAPANRIFSNTLTVTGSIGVFLGKVNFEGLYKKIDLKKEIISSSPYAGILSEARPWTKEERAIMVRRLNQYYEGFVQYVAANRNISKEEAEKAAKGRVWMGTDAKRLKLVDDLGGYREAVKYAADAGGIGSDTFDADVIRESYGLFGFNSEDLLLSKESGLVDSALSILGPQTIRELLWMSQLQENPFLYWSPTRIF